MTSSVIRALAAPDLGWVRHRGDGEHWHAIDEIACGSVMTLCGGCMSVSAPFDLEARPAWPDRCARCQTLYAQRRLVEVGLAELCANTEVG